MARPTFLKYAVSPEAHSFREVGHFILTSETFGIVSHESGVSVFSVVNN
ncbi:hypothetical protein D1AOALGA4SA_11300 [Olavius algarvensis Delta 1 endosymbiont]|nr:hypothetical protein D1AOALGA4SA_11300 [Olavius algarvensis Delta 1 endosymbiont]